MATDYVASAYTAVCGVDKYIVAINAQKTELERRGVPGEKIFVHGIPVHPDFFGNASPSKARCDLDERPVVLVMSGSLGLGPVKRIVAALEKRGDVQIRVIAGHNQKLLRSLDETGDLKKLGFVDNVSEWMRVSDLIVTRPSGITTAEAIATRRPMLLIQPFPNQEEENMAFLLERGCALRWSESEAARLLGDEQAIARMRESQRSLFPAAYMDDLAREILRGEGPLESARRAG